jgi:hypothetical protein
MKAYIISFYQQEVSDDELIAFLDGRREILNLARPLPNTVFIASDRNAGSLTELIERKFPQSFFIVAEYVPYNSDGSLTGDMWEFLNNPKSKRGRRVKKPVSTKRRVAQGRTVPERK